MSETRFESELVKSLEKLDEIMSKSQINQGDGHQPDSWEGGDIEEYDTDTDTKWDDNIDEGGDYHPKGMKKAHKEEEGEEEGEEEAQDGGEDKEAFEKMLAASVKKAMDEYEEEGKEEDDEDVKKGVEVSEFLSELTKSIAVYSNYLEDYVSKSILQLHEEHGGMAKAIAENLVILSDMIQKSEGNISEYSEEPARAPKSVVSMEKSMGGEEAPQMSKDDMLNRLVKGVEDGMVSPLEVIKFEQLGSQAVSQDVFKSLLAS